MACLHRNTAEFFFPFIQETINDGAFICSECLLWIKGNYSGTLSCLQIAGIELLLGKMDANPRASPSHVDWYPGNSWHIPLESAELTCM